MYVMTKTGESLPKYEALPGSLRREWMRCGTPTCRCARGELHGPYWYRRWREGSQQRKQYVKPADVVRVRAALAQWKLLHPSIWQLRKRLAEMNDLSRALEE